MREVKLNAKFARCGSAVAKCLVILSAFCIPAMCGDVPVPSQCTPAVNAKLQKMIRDNPRGYVENVMVCGVAEKTVVHGGGRHGSHHVVTLAVDLPQDGRKHVQVAINDALDGKVDIPRNATLFAYGQGYIAHGAWVAGIHDVHCATHRGADNGWVSVNGHKTPASCPKR